MSMLHSRRYNRLPNELMDMGSARAEFFEHHLQSDKPTRKSLLDEEYLSHSSAFK